jgi:hypothetical protein
MSRISARPRSASPESASRSCRSAPTSPSGSWVPCRCLRKKRSPRTETSASAPASVGIHYGTFELADDGELEPAQEIERILAAAPDPKPRFWLLDNGEGRDVPPL